MEISREKAKEDGFFVYSDEEELVKSCDAVLVAVKPIHAKSLFEKISKYLDGKLVVSIVAGLESEVIRSYIGEQRILRIMPNTPALVGEGVFALDSDSNATDEEKKIFEDAFFKIGTVEWVEERLFPVVTGLSGGGPAYVAIFIEALADAGGLHGLKRDAVLKDMVCSPAGTTIEGVKALEDYSFRAGVIEAVSKATLKSMK